MSENLTYRKKLIEVALPLEAINKESAREKSIRHGHPSTLHLWWARRPLAACRAVLFASLVDDPSAWPELFPSEEEQDAERKRLFDLIEELVKWENVNNENIILKAQTEIARSIARENQEEAPEGKADIQKYLTEKAPPVLDPFCGGGSIPLEAQRLGLRAYASDLNPVAVLITKAMVEIPPKFANQPPINPQVREDKDLFNKEWKGARGLAEDVRYYGKWIRDEAVKRIGKYYPRVRVTSEMAKDRPDLKIYVGKELKVIAWLYARTVASPNPAYNRYHVPLMRSYLLSNSKKRQVWLEPIIDRRNNSYTFMVKTGKIDKAKIDAISKGNKITKGASFKCLLSGELINKDHIRNEFKAKRNDVVMTTIIAEGINEKVYISPLNEHKDIIREIEPNWYPEEEMNINTPNLISGRGYGILYWKELFTNRQLMTLTTFSDLIREVPSVIMNDINNIKSSDSVKNSFEHINDQYAREYVKGISTYISFILSRQSNYSSSFTTWGGEFIVQTFGRQALPMVWDFCEGNPFSDSTGNWNGAIEWVVKCLEKSIPARGYGQVKQLDAMTATNEISSPLISTDPPYYDNIGYADLSDYFYIWHRHSIGDIYPDLFSTVLTPKINELIATPYRHKGNQNDANKYFENGLFKAFSNMNKLRIKNFPLTIYYGFRQTETSESHNKDEVFSSIVSTGWETMLEGVLKAGFSINGTWPIRTERDQGLKSGTNVLASSVVLVCHPKKEDSPLATRLEFIRTLKKELPGALENLQQGNIAPVDLAQAAIGPGMSIYSRFKRVMESDGAPMTIRTALIIINQMLDEILIEQEGEFDSSTRWALSWYEQHGVEDGPYGVAETLSKAKNTAVSVLVEAGIVLARGGKVRLLRRTELNEDWDPSSEKHLTIWEITQHLIYALEKRGEKGAAELLLKIGALGETARDLAYRLYSICERKNWAQEALAYNSLVIAWPEITKLARKQQTTTKPQEELF